MSEREGVGRREGGEAAREGGREGGGDSRLGRGQNGQTFPLNSSIRLRRTLNS